MKNPLLWIGVVLLAVIVAGIVGAWLHTQRKQKQERLQRVKQRVHVRTVTGMETLSLRRQETVTSAWVEALSRRLPNAHRLTQRLSRAEMKVSGQQYILLCGVYFCVVVAGMNFVLHKPLWMGMAVGAFVALWMPLKVVDSRIHKRLKKFLQLFPDGIDLIVRGLRSGLPVSESVTLVAKEVGAPVGPVFTTITNTMKLGVPLEKALQETAANLGCTEFNFFTTSIALQRETGGNLSEILNNLSEVLRQRIMMQMKIKAMTSEARASGIIVGALPFCVGGMVALLSPDYIAPLFTDPRGNVALAMAVGTLSTGVYIMRRLSRFEL